MNEFINDFKEKNNIERIVLLITELFIFTICLLVIAYIFGFFAATGKTDNSYIWYGLHSPTLRKTIIAALVTYLFVTTRLKAKQSLRNSVSGTDKKGVHYAKNKTFGDAEILRKASDIKKICNVGDVEDTTATIYGKIGDSTKQVVSKKTVTSGPTGNDNVLIISPMGGGKTYGPVSTNLIQTILRGDSFVASDPSSDLYRNFADWLEKRNVDTKKLDFSNLDFSDFWNCLEETINPETERLDSSRLNDFALIYIQNSGDKGVEFWYSSAINLISAVIGYVAYKKESWIINRFVDLYKKITGTANDAIAERMKTTLCSFKWCREKIIEVAVMNGANVEDVKQLLYEIQYELPPVKFNIDEVYRALLHFNDIEEEFDDIPDWYPAKDSYLMFLTNDGESVRNSALQGTQLRFKIFSDEKVRNIFSHDGIHISDLTAHQSAYFVVPDDKSEKLRPLLSLFFSYVFKDCEEERQKAEDIAVETGEPNKRLPLTVMLDEFYSMGIIGGDVDAFGTIMSNSRKYKFYIYIVIQSYSQLAARYGEKIGNIIQGGCNTILFLGGNDPDTCNFISKFATGETTVIADSYSESDGFIKRTDNNTNVSATMRYLLTISEARKWKYKVLLIIHGENPIELNLFGWKEHPITKDFVAVSTKNKILPLERRLDLESQKNYSYGAPDKYFKKKLKEINSKVMHKGELKFDAETGELIEENKNQLSLFDIDETTVNTKKTRSSSRTKKKKENVEILD